MAWFARLAIRWKLLLGFGSTVAILAVVVIAGLYGVRQLEQEFSTVVERDVPSTTLLLNLDRDAYQAQYALEAGMAERDPAARAALLQGYRDNVQQIGERWQAYKAVAILAP